MANGLLGAFIYVLSYFAEVIYNLMEGGPRQGALFCLIVLWRRRRILTQRIKKEDKERNKMKSGEQLCTNPSESFPDAILHYLSLFTPHHVYPQHLWVEFYITRLMSPPDPHGVADSTASIKFVLPLVNNVVRDRQVRAGGSSCFFM